MKNVTRWMLLLLLVLAGSGVCMAQSTGSGDIRGTVTDSTGALIPNVTVTVLNVDTGVAKDFVTNKDGLYDTASIVAGNYKITFKKDGFEQLVRGPVTVLVGMTGVNAQLQVGAATVQITVNTDVPLLNTETGDQTSTLEAKSMDELPNMGGNNSGGPDWQNFMILMPGAAGTASSNAGSSNPGQEISTNGNMPFTNVLADGASVTLPDSQNANPTVFEDVEELQVSLSSFSAQFGVGGLIVNQITKGGGSKFHGSAYEYFQNDDLNAANFGFGGKNSVPRLRFDDYGGTVSGPIKVLGLGKKAFFFFGYDRIVNNTLSSGFNTVPTAQVMAGQFVDVGKGVYTIYNPVTQVIKTDSKSNAYPVRTAFTGNAIPAAMIDKVAGNIQKYYPTAANSVGHFVAGNPLASGVLQNNWSDQYPNPRPWRRFFGRLDYDITPKNRFTMTDTQGDELESGDNAVTQCPIGCQLADVDNNNAQVTDVWNISPTVINELRLGYTDQLNFFEDPSLDKNYPQTLGWQFAKSNVMPSTQFTRSYPYAWIQPGTNAQYKEFTFDPSDVVTMIRGKHVMHFGGEWAFYRGDNTPWGNINAGTLGFSGAYTESWDHASCGTGPTVYADQMCPNSGTGEEYADLLLGYANYWNAGFTPEAGARLKKPQFFMQDDWKVRPNITINMGLRYEASHGFNEVKGNEATFDPTATNSDQTLGAYWYGSTHANGRASLQKNVFDTFLPRIGFSWQPKPNMTVRGGYGLYTYNWSLDNYGSGMGAAVASSGSISDQSNGIYPVVKYDGPGTTNPLGGGAQAQVPYTSASTAPNRFNGQNVSFNPYKTPIPKINQYNFGIERQLREQWVATVTYVGSRGYNLTSPTDINAIPETGATTRPFTEFGQIQGNLYEAISNYNALQAVVTKRISQGLSLSFNYSWSRMMDTQDSSGWGSHAGAVLWQHASSLTNNMNRFNYGPSNFDVRQAFKGYAVYQLPFGKGKQFLNNNFIADEVLGGWQISGTVVESTGNPFQPTSPGAGNFATKAGGATQYPNRVVGVSTTPVGGRSWKNWFNEAALSQPASGQFGTLGRNPLYGPGINYFNLSGAKTFNLGFEGAKFELRVDSTNAFNHPSFGAFSSGNSGYNLSGTPGAPFSGNAALSQLTVDGRSVQLAGRFTF